MIALDLKLMNFLIYSVCVLSKLPLFFNSVFYSQINSMGMGSTPFLLLFQLYQWPSNSALKAGRWEVPGSIAGSACRPSLSEFSVVFSESHINTAEGIPLSLRPLVQAIGLKLKHNISTCFILFTCTIFKKNSSDYINFLISLHAMIDFLMLYFPTTLSGSQ